MKQIAFWRYDEFPYVLSGEVVKMDDDGKVTTKEYGIGFRFQPIKILPLAAGKKLRAALNKLTRDYNAAAKKFDAEWQDKAVALYGKVPS